MAHTKLGKGDTCKQGYTCVLCQQSEPTRLFTSDEPMYIRTKKGNKSKRIGSISNTFVFSGYVLCAVHGSQIGISRIDKIKFDD